MGAGAPIRRAKAPAIETIVQRFQDEVMPRVRAELG